MGTLTVCNWAVSWARMLGVWEPLKEEGGRVCTKGKGTAKMILEGGWLGVYHM